MPQMIISDTELSRIIEDATRRGYALARRDAENSERLDGIAAVLGFLHISERTFRNNRKKGMYGDAVIGKGRNIWATKSGLVDAMRAYRRGML